jgi:protein tyrosine phosphatase
MKGPLPEDSDNKIDVPVSKFAENYYQMTALDNVQIINEYKLINAIDGDTLGFTNNAAKQNETKNRYTNIHPYDENRVLLGTHNGFNDYINASWVNVSQAVIDGWTE